MLAHISWSITCFPLFVFLTRESQTEISILLLLAGYIFCLLFKPLSNPPAPPFQTVLMSLFDQCSFSAGLEPTLRIYSQFFLFQLPKLWLRAIKTGATVAQILSYFCWWSWMLPDAPQRELQLCSKQSSTTAVLKKLTEDISRILWSVALWFKEPT